MAYTGIFIRQVQGQRPTDPSQGSCGCPDIVFAGLSDPGPATFATQASYAWTSPSDVYFQRPNYVYLRGYQSNTTNGSNLFLYHVPSSLALWPQNWSPSDVMIGSSKTPQNWSYAPPTPGNAVVVNSQALVWTPQNIDVNVEHYCTIAWADNSTKDNPIPPPFSQLGNMSSFDELMYFLSTHPNMGWRNTTDHPTPPPSSQYSSYISTQDSPETVNITVNFNNIPDGTFMVNVTGDVQFTSGPTPLNVSNYLGGYQVLIGGGGLPFAANQTALLMVTYDIGPTPLSKYASITADINHVIAGTMMSKMQALAASPGAILPIKQMAMGVGRTMAVKPVFVLGRQQWNLIGTAG